MADVNWITVLVSSVSALVGGGVTLGGFMVTWGSFKTKVQNHQQRLDCSNGKIDEQAKQDRELYAEIEGIKSTQKSRDTIFQRNHQDHVEMFSRINALEKGYAALPGQMAEMMDARFKEWQKVLQKHIKATIYEIDNEKQGKK